MPAQRRQEHNEDLECDEDVESRHNVLRYSMSVCFSASLRAVPYS